MALIFEYEKDLETGSQPFMSHEKDSTIYNYYVDDEAALDKSAKSNFGYYDDIEFADESRHLTTKAVSNIGIKNFPGIGGIGFYKDAYSDESRLVVPIHPENVYYVAPVLKTIELVNGRLHIVIEPPEDIVYTCYRVIVRQDAFAFEYILYKPDYMVEVPTVRGPYVAYCMGYDENNGAVSEYSNELNFEMPTGTDTWAPSSGGSGGSGGTVDLSEIYRRLEAIEEEIVDYEDTEVHEDVAEVIATVAIATVAIPGGD